MIVQLLVIIGESLDFVNIGSVRLSHHLQDMSIGAEFLGCFDFRLPMTYTSRSYNPNQGASKSL
jgi:hypothetical protein